MVPEDAHCHSASIAVEAPAETAFAYLADGLQQGEWTLGASERRETGDGLFVGTSIFDGSEVYVGIEAAAEHLLVTCLVGDAPDELVPRIWVRVVPGEALGRPEGTCVVTLLAWRPAAQSDDAWRRTCATHETEVFLIKGLLERRVTG